MIEHAYEQHPVFTTRDHCERKFDDDGRVGFCGRPRSEHMDEVHGLKVQLATALRERDEQKARADAAEAKSDRLSGAILRLLRDGCGPGGGHYEPDQRLAAAVGLLEVGWGR